MITTKQAKPLKTHILIALASIYSILFFVVGVSLFQILKLENIANGIIETKVPTVETNLVIRTGIYESAAALRGWLINQNDTFKEERNLVWQTNIIPNIAKLKALSANWTIKENVIRLNKIEKELMMLKNFQDEVQAAALSNITAAKELWMSKTVNLTADIYQLQSELINSQNESFTRDLNNIKESILYLTITEALMLILGLLLSIYIGIRMNRSIVKPVDELTYATREVAKGHLVEEVKIDGPYEIQELVTSINQMIETMREITKVTTLVSQGNYVTEQLTPRSNKDELIISLMAMTKTLRENKAFYENQIWLQNGINALVERISTNPELDIMCEATLSEICHYLKAGLGALYLADDEKTKLSLFATYAFVERQALSNTYELGKGIVGQVALEKKAILLKNINRSDVVISTATTEEAPLNTYTFPLTDKRELIGVIELAFHEEISDIKIEYLNKIISVLSSSIRVAQQTLITERMLNEQKVLTEELQTQQEELRSANEELEAQTEELKTSEEELRQRDEEQKTLNTELEEQNKILEAQKAEVERAQKTLVKKAEELQVASKYKTEFLANMSHELRTPLNSLLILAKMLTENKEGNLNKDQLESVQVIHSSGQELLQLINDILDLAKVEAGKITIDAQDINLDNFIQVLERDFRHVAETKNLSFTIEKDPSLPTIIHSDEQRVKQIVKNLLSNAFKFTEHGSVRVRFSRPTAGTEFKNSTIKPQNTIAIAVTDSGIGIPSDQQALIFQSFYQGDGSTSRKYGGTGLGLSISMELAKLLGGELQLHSEVGKGSTFTFYIPEQKTAITTEPTPPKEESTAATLATPEPTTAKEKSLLIIEDDVQFAKILMDVCAKKGFKCYCAKTGYEGLQLAQKYLPKGILLDYSLPDTSGLSLIEQLKRDEKTKDIPVHFISGADKKEEAFKVGAVSYLMKPITIEQLDAAMQGITKLVDKSIRNLLLVEDDPALRTTISKLFTDTDTHVTAVSRGKDALNLLKTNHYDCMILDLGLPDISGFTILKTLNSESNYDHPPVIIYTGRELSEDEHTLLHSYSNNIIIKSKASMDRLLDETTLFLHSIETALPLAQQKKPTLKIDAQQQFHGKRVLLVDDDMKNTFALAKVLRGYDMEVLIAPNGKVALEILEKEPLINATLMDIMMPVMDGYETIKNIRKQAKFSKLPIIALTAKTMPQDKEKCLAAGATDYLPKPLDVDKLLVLLRAWL